MTASNVSIIQLADLIEEYLVQERATYLSIAADLRKVTGNKSVTSTCAYLALELEKRAPA
jgi:hypothetical protein